MIPNIIHFIFGLKSDFGGKGFSYIHYLAVVTAWKVNQPEKMFLHYAYEPSGEWWDKAKPYLTLNQVVPPKEIFGRPLKHFAHQADVLRLEMLMQHGGIYLDMDVVCINSFGPLLRKGFVMGREPEAGLCNAVILASADAEFLRIWYEQYREFDGTRWGYHSVALPLQLATQHPSMIQIQDEYSFFFPMHNDPAHTDLWGDRPPWAQRQIFEKIIEHLRVRIGNFFASKKEALPFPPLTHLIHGRRWQFEKLSQSYCIHLWESIWWDHLQQVTPDSIRENRGNFSRIVRKVLGPNLGEVLPVAGEAVHG